jgi:hypothetical protein
MTTVVAALEIERRRRVTHVGVIAKDDERALDPAYRPCSVCMPQEYLAWKERQTQEATSE